MADYTIYPTKAAVVSSAYPNTHLSLGSEVELDPGGDSSNERRMLLLGFDFDDIPEDALYRSISCDIYIYATKLSYGHYHQDSYLPDVYPDKDYNGYSGHIFEHIFDDDFDPNTVTARDFMPPATRNVRMMNNGPEDFATALPALYSDVNYVQQWITEWQQTWLKTIGITGYIDYLTEYYWTAVYSVVPPSVAALSNSATRPYVVLHAGEVIQPSITGASPSSGYVPKNQSSQFSWGFKFSSNHWLGEIKQTSAIFRYRAGTSGAAQTISVGADPRVTIPAGTFTTDTVQWQVTVTFNSGVSATSDWYTLSTVESLSEAVPISPVGSLVDGSMPITFSWNHIIATGTTQTKAELQYSLNGSGSWTSLATVTGPATTYTAPANTFEAGTVSWRVRTYNSDNQAGEWSAASDFIVMVAPDAPSVQCTSGTSPRVAISWQTTGQQAYEVEVGNIKSGLQFGVAQSWVCPDYLPDGQYIVRVRVGNKYDLWSEWGTCAVTVANTVGEAIALTATAGHTVQLSWQTQGEYDAFFVLRDGVPIARTTARSYVDNFAAGAHAYSVRGTYADSGNYGLSNEVHATVSCDTAYISPVPEANWLRLGYADTQDRRTSVSVARSVEYVHLCGGRYPTAEVSDFWEGSMGVVCAMREPAEYAALEALAGRLVCIKDQWGNMAIGILDSISKQSAHFFQTYSFTVSRVDYTEEVAYD